MNQQKAEQNLLNLIQSIAEGHYSNDIMEFTKDGVPQSLRIMAEAMGMMMVKVEAREFRLEQMVEELQILNVKIKQNTIKTVSAMAQALAARDTYTEGHTTRVSILAQKLALKLGMNEEEAEFVKLGGQLHDIGKIGFSDPLFNEHNKKNPS